MDGTLAVAACGVQHLLLNNRAGRDEGRCCEGLLAYLRK
jgi:hypothetical protein